LDTRCASVDTWAGDPHSGDLQAGILDDLRAHHDPLYGGFSRLIQSTFDGALRLFDDRSIDLLHIDGYHTYEAVRHDFDSWLPKLSERGVVLLHDAAVREGDFGVWRLWQQTASQYPSLLFPHGFGLGVLVVGPDANPDLRDFVDEASNDDGTLIRLFAALGERLVSRTREKELESTRDQATKELRASSEEVGRVRAQLATTESDRQKVLERQHELEERIEVEQQARLELEQHVRNLMATRTYRYSAPARRLYGRLRHTRGGAKTLSAEASAGIRTSPRRQKVAVDSASSEFVPPGHFYSAIPSLEELIARRSEIFDQDPRNVAGVELRITEQLSLLDQLTPLLSNVPFGGADSPRLRYRFANGMFDRSDGLFLHLLLRHYRPSRIVEIGSGHSSACILDTVERFLPHTTCSFVDPNCDVLRSLLRPEDRGRVEIIEQPAQAVPRSLYTALRAGDLLFVDSTHVVKAGSDVNYILFDVLPRLEPGVVVHVHDVFPGFEYPWSWVSEGRVWSESYLLRAFLEFNSAFEILLWPPLIARTHPERYALFSPPNGNTGGSIYLRRVST
jgi:hypothetical protein